MRLPIMALAALALALAACGNDGEALSSEAGQSAAAADTTDAAEAPAPDAAEPRDETAIVTALLADYFRRVDEGGNTAELFPPEGEPTIFDAYAPVTLVDYEIGEPLVEGAAGSLYASVPVRYAFTEDMTGEAHSFEGEIVLRRVNDVPGSTAAQRRWHFDRAEPAGE